MVGIVFQMGAAKNTGLFLPQLPISRLWCLPEGGREHQHFVSCPQHHVAKIKFWSVIATSWEFFSSLQSPHGTEALAQIQWILEPYHSCLTHKADIPYDEWPAETWAYCPQPPTSLANAPDPKAGGLLKEECVTFPTLSFREEQKVWPEIKAGHKTQQWKHFLKELTSFATECGEIQA